MNSIKQNYPTLILTALVVIAVLVGAYFFLSKGDSYAPTVQTEITVIEDSKDLDNASQALDSSDLDSVDSSLDEIDSDLSSF